MYGEESKVSPSFLWAHARDDELPELYNTVFESILDCLDLGNPTHQIAHDSDVYAILDRQKLINLWATRVARTMEEALLSALACIRYGGKGAVAQVEEHFLRILQYRDYLIGLDDPATRRTPQNNTLLFERKSALEATQQILLFDWFFVMQGRTDRARS